MFSGEPSLSSWEPFGSKIKKVSIGGLGVYGLTTDDNIYTWYGCYFKSASFFVIVGL